MQQVLPLSRLDTVASHIDATVRDWLKAGHPAAFEAHPYYDIMLLNWYDTARRRARTKRVVLYLDKEDFLILCEDEPTAAALAPLLPDPAESTPNDMAVRAFFANLIANDIERLEAIETDVTNAEDAALTRSRKAYMNKIITFRRELLQLKRYYTRLDLILDGLADNENQLLGEEALHRLTFVSRRVAQCAATVLTLRDYVTQMREAYQAQIDIEQNELMRLFTLVTAIFTPLTLMVGWYGMNFRNMPALEAQWGYPVFIAASVAITVGLLWFFRKKKWL